MDIRTGEIIHGENEQQRYEVIEFRGRGSFGEVFKIKETSSGDIFALKTIPTSYLKEDDLNALINEGQLATQIIHPNVIRYFYFHDGHTYQHLPPYIIMEYASGGTLADLIRQREGRPFTNSELVEIFTQLSEGMKAINAKLVHRDIKPDNILIEKDKLKISDFGLAKVVDAATRSSTFKGFGHIRYAAPEAWQSQPNTPPMDIYSMGIVFYEVATLKHPFEVASAKDEVQAWREAHLFGVVVAPERHNSGLCTALSQVIRKMLNKKPEDRYQDWDQILTRIKGSVEEKPKSIDVKNLLEKARRTVEERERARLETEKERLAEEEHRKLVTFRSEELKTAVNEIVNEFNRASDDVRLRIAESELLEKYRNFVSLKVEGIQGYVELKIYPVWDDLKLRNQKILAWGYFKASNGVGLNILLLQESATDYYGQWYAIHTRWSGLVLPEYKDNRPEPFAFEDYKEFVNELPNIGVMHIYNFDVGIFSRQMLLPLIESVL